MSDAVPALAALQESVDALNAFVHPRAVRAYQDAALRGEPLTVASPFDGAPVSAEGAVVWNAAFIGYRFGGARPFWLLGAALWLGFPLADLVTLDEQPPVDLARRDAKRAPPPDEVRSVVARMEALWGRARPDPGPPVLILGHPNFAHHLWNELAGLDRWVAANPLAAKTPEVLAGYQPLGAIDALFPELAGRVAAWKPATRVFRGRLAVRIGSTRIGPAVRQRVQRLALARHPQPPKQGRTFWVSVRNDGRTLENGDAFLDALVPALAARHPGATILIDCFSYAEDFAAAGYDFARERLVERERDAAGSIDRAIARLAPEVDARLVNLSGCGLLEAMAATRDVDYYVAHAGSVQHKLGWIWNGCGYVHTCTAGLSASSLRWYADQVEGGLVPDGAPVALVEDREPSGAHVAQTRNLNYRVEVAPLVADILAKVDAALAPAAPPVAGSAAVPQLTRTLLHEQVEKHGFAIGDFTYGKPTVLLWKNSGTLSIGRYCSIAGGVEIFLGGNHRTDFVTTYPFSVFFDHARHIPGHPATNGDVRIGNDVWLGRNCRIMSGVTVGDGACIAAEALVAKDVPPYAIVGGNPGRVLRLRFTEAQIADLLAIRWWDWPDDVVARHVELLMSPDIDRFIAAAKAVTA